MRIPKFDTFKVKRIKKGKIFSHYLVKCNDCNAKFKLYVPLKSELRRDNEYAFSEICGVIGTRKDWKKLFTLLNII